MKIRTDFVTNSSSSSFCVMTVSLKDGREISWSGEDGAMPVFMVPRNAEALLKEIKSIDDLIRFMHSCAAADGLSEEDAKESFEENCMDFKSKLGMIPSVDDLRGIELSWSEYQSDSGEDPISGSVGERMNFSFVLNKFWVDHRPDPGFISSMMEIYSGDFDLEADEPDCDSCEGITFAITGDLEMFENRAELTEYIEENGGKVSSGVTRKTDYLISNEYDSESSKSKKARELAIPIISEEEFVFRFGGGEISFETPDEDEDFEDEDFEE